MEVNALDGKLKNHSLKFRGNATMPCMFRQTTGNVNVVVLALGSNVGSRKNNLEAAVRLLPIYNGHCSYIYETRALLPDGAPTWWDMPYLNMVMCGYVNLSPDELLGYIKHVEYTLGRSNTGTWGPRPIDVDILLYDGLSMQSDALTIPHKEMHKRDFVLVPACDVCPRSPHTVLKTTLETILSSMQEVDVVKKYGPLSCTRT
ncbi:2-amino-4-hydroxy-6-hydroxymethyldihydropteridine diphosphokinase [Anaplasma marginale]|uniref:2-amino-4-hydroxy-6- hydroxymethyldihydropteridine diphosphokinase n=1 Tax=Anaplasma marginale TaxID=770 RepID=UPI001CD98659|nr:2-amino-4-hydroxy-6-hydroxymethyldihydropteridine diphosphokinase [Anaplasma marginale]